MASFLRHQTALSPSARGSIRSGASGRNHSKTLQSAPHGGSAFSRIFSSKNVTSNILPTFMVSDQAKKGLTEDELQKFNILNAMYSNPQESLSKTQVIFDSRESLGRTQTEGDYKAGLISPEPAQRQSLPINNRLKISTEKIEEIKKIEKVTRDIFNPTLKPSETILSIRKRELKREDLVKLREGVDLPECVVDCYLSILKHTNSLRIRYTPGASRVLIASASFSSMIFLKGREIAQPKSNVFKYDFLLFPINVGYWTLLIVDMKRMTVKYYDPVKEHKTVSIVMTRLTKFIQKAAPREDQRVNTNFQFIPTPVPNIHFTDSGVFVCTEAENIACGKNNKITKESTDSYRKDMLAALVKASSI